jgi:hypothetical protein
VRRHFELLPADYGRFTAPATIIEHLRLVSRRNAADGANELEGRSADALHRSSSERAGIDAACWRR